MEIRGNRFFALINRDKEQIVESILAVGGGGQHRTGQAGRVAGQFLIRRSPRPVGTDDNTFHEPLTGNERWAFRLFPALRRQRRAKKLKLTDQRPGW